MGSEHGFLHHFTPEFEFLNNFQNLNNKRKTSSTREAGTICPKMPPNLLLGREVLLERNREYSVPPVVPTAAHAGAEQSRDLGWGQAACHDLLWAPSHSCCLPRCTEGCQKVTQGTFLSPPDRTSPQQSNGCCYLHTPSLKHGPMALHFLSKDVINICWGLEEE